MIRGESQTREDHGRRKELSRQFRSACLEATGFENKMWERIAAKEMYAKGLLNEAATALQLVKFWPEESLYREELALSRESDGMYLAGTRVRQAMEA